MENKLLLIAFMLAMASSLGFCQARKISFDVFPKDAPTPPPGTKPTINPHPPPQIASVSTELNLRTTTKLPPRTLASKGKPGQINPTPPSISFLFDEDLTSGPPPDVKLPPPVGFSISKELYFGGTLSLAKDYGPTVPSTPCCHDDTPKAYEISKD